MSRAANDLLFDADRLIAEGRALRTLARSLLDDARADDLVHDSYVAALRQPAGVRSAGPWLTGVVQRLAARWRRTDARRNAREQLIARDEIDAASDPARIAAEAETLRAIASAVHELDEPFRTVIVLRFWHDMPTGDIATRLRVPPETVRSRLHRGLERLRARLDARTGGRAAWCGTLSGFVPVKKAAAVATPAVTMVGATGFLMNAKVLLGGVAAIAAAVVAVTTWPAASAPIAAPEAHAAIKPAAANDVAEERAPERELVAGTGAVAPALAAADGGLVAPWQLRRRVVDGDGRPLEAAAVLVWRPLPSRSQPGYYSNLEHEDVPVATLRTSVLGTAELTLDRECVALRADHDGAMSLEHVVFWQRAAHGFVLRIDKPVVLRGKVGLPDGAPAAGAVVSATPRGTTTKGHPPSASTTADTHGEFELRVPPRLTYRMQATLRGAHTFVLERSTDADDPPPALLTFPGSISVRGTVVDADGVPVYANVRVWHADWRTDRTYEEDLRLRTDTAGQFATDLLRHRRYGILATASAATSEVLFVEPTPERPHVDVVVKLSRFATIGGTVHRTDGSPLANAEVYASAGPHDSAAEPEPDRRELFPTAGAVSTGADGRFTLRVHPAVRWAVVVRPLFNTPTLEVRRDDVAPGTTDCTFVVSDDDLRGCTIVATVTVPLGTVAAECTFSIEDLDGMTKNMLQPPTGKPDGERLRFDPLGVGRTIALRVTPPQASALAPLRIAPLRTIPGELRVDVPLQRFAEVDVRVEFPRARPVRPVWVSVMLATGQPCVEPLKPDGVARLRHCCPGDNTLTILEEGLLDSSALWQQQLVLVPGENPAIVVTVAEAKAPR